MAITKKSMDVAIENIKDFFKNLINPNMKIEDIAEIVSSRLDSVIIEHEKNGLHYSAGKFYIKAVEEKNFQLEFEMFFKDDADKWHKLANQSELRDIALLEQGAVITLQKLKVIEFPISAPEITPEIKADTEKEKVEKVEAEKPVEEKIEDITGVTAEKENIVEDKTAIKTDKDEK